MNFTPGPLPANGAVYAPEIAAFRNAVYVALCQPGKPWGIPESGDREHHVATIADRFLSIAPTAFSGFVMSMTIGDEDAAMSAIEAGLDVMFQADQNLFRINGCNAKQLYRVLNRIQIHDRASADAAVDYVGPTESRLEAYNIARLKGITVEKDLIDRALALDEAIREAKIQKEKDDLAASLARIKRKSSEISTTAPERTIFGGRR